MCRCFVMAARSGSRAPPSVGEEADPHFSFLLSSEPFCSPFSSFLNPTFCVVRPSPLFSLQGMLPLTFADPSDYDRISGNDKVSILGLGSFAPGKPLKLRVTPAKAGIDPFDVTVNHTFNQEQIEWFKAGSALNLMKEVQAKA
ncbi:unnamed protein product [Phaeothamnion confervicola]